MFINGKMLGISGGIVMATSLVAMSIGGCDTEKPLPPADKMPGCNGGGFIVAMKSGKGTCPAVEKLLNAGKDLNNPPWVCKEICGGGDVPVPAKLRGYASLTYNPNADTTTVTPDAQTLRELPGMSEIVDYVEEDCLVSAPQGEMSLTQEAGPELNKALRTAAGADFDASVLQGIPMTPSFTIALDTLTQDRVEPLFGKAAGLAPPPDPKTFPFGKNEHGWTVLAIIRDLTSLVINPSPAEPTEVAVLDAKLALPSVDYDNIDLQHGGHFARQFHLAEAICGAIEAWEDRYSSINIKDAPPPVVVMALGSLPIEGQKCDSEDAILQQPTLAPRLIYYAMQHAACHGAAIVAAAGNDPNGRSVTLPDCLEVKGATCPGAMSKIQAPTREECIDLYKESGRYEPDDYNLNDKPIPNPLVHVISGVDGNRSLLSIAREDSNSRLAAIGARGGAMDPWGNWHIPLTGTSISTAVAAAAFATLFAYKPSLTAAEAADILYNSALPTNPEEKADDGSGDPMKVISICKALELALEKPEGTFGCPTVADLDANPSVAITLTSAPASAISFPVTNAEVKDLASSKECGGNSPLLNPAPGSSRCRPDCGYLIGSQRRRASIQLDGGNEVGYSGLTLILQAKNGTTEAFTLANFGFAPGSVLELDGIDSKFSDDELSSVRFEALLEGDGYSSVVSGEIPIFKEP